MKRLITFLSLFTGILLTIASIAAGVSSFLFIVNGYFVAGLLLVPVFVALGSFLAMAMDDTTLLPDIFRKVL